MPSQTQNLHYYWLHESSLNNDESLTVKTTGWKGNDHYTDEEHIPNDAGDLDVWHWIHDNRYSLPNILPAELLPHLIKEYRRSVPEINIPDDGYYFIESKWSDHAVMAQHELVAAHARTPLPRTLYLVDSKSRDPKIFFPQLVSLFKGWGELIGFKDGKCDLFMQLGEDMTYLEDTIGYLYRHNIESPEEMLEEEAG